MSLCAVLVLPAVTSAQDLAGFVAAVPEPESILLFGAALVGLAASRKWTAKRA